MHGVFAAALLQLGLHGELSLKAPLTQAPSSELTTSGLAAWAWLRFTAVHQAAGLPGPISAVSSFLSPDGHHLRGTAQCQFLWSLFILLVSVSDES